MNCANCGAPIPAGVRKCPYCGVTLHGNTAGRQIGEGEETVFDGGGTIFVSKEAHTGGQGGWSGQMPGYDNSVLQAGGESEETEFVPLGVPVQPTPAPSMSPTRPSKKQRGSSRRGGKRASPGRKNNPLRVMLIILFIMVLLLLVAKEILLPKLRDLLPTYTHADVLPQTDAVSFFEESMPVPAETTEALPD